MDLKCTFAASALLSVLAIFPVQASTSYANLYNWHVERFDPTSDAQGACLAKGNGEHIALIQRTDRQWYVQLGPFTTLREGGEYSVDMQITSPYGNYRYVLTFSLKDRFLIAPVSTDLVNELAADSGVYIWLRYFVPGTRAYGYMRLDNSAEAIRTVVHCREAVQMAARPPEASPKGQDAAIYTGTGFFVASKLILTDDHVIDACGDIFVRYPGDRPARAYVTSRDQHNDLALLATGMNNRGVASFATDRRVGQQVATYGFPLLGQLSSSGNFTIGNITALAGFRDDTTKLQTSVPIQPGNSGGPLMDMSGSVIGVMEATLRMSVKDPVPQGLNFAIQSPIVLNFLSANGAKPILGSEGKERDARDLADLAKQFTVQVVCSGAAAADGSR
jgi:S1-C subfamily serine protease